jgi:ribosomal protein S18 acetylase RimI-like enzyme
MEELSANAWAAFSTSVYDGWLVRSAEGYTKRANSVLPLYSSTIELRKKMEYCSDYYRSRGLPVIFKMTEASLPRELDAHLAAEGFASNDESSLYVLHMGQPSRLSSGRTVIDRTISDAWIDGFIRCSRIDALTRRGITSRFARHLPGATLAARSVVDEEIAGCGIGVVEDGWVGLFDIVVDPDRRRQGIATEIVSALLDHSAEMGARWAYLQVLERNEAAKRLYTGLGFSELYRYWYRVNSELIHSRRE